MLKFGRDLAGTFVSILIATGVSTAQSSSPRLSVTPSSGPAASQVQAVGSGFGPDVCGANIYFDSSNGPVLGFSQVHNGAFTMNIVIPPDAPDGSHPLLALAIAVSGSYCIGRSSEQAQTRFMVGEESPGPFEGQPVAPFVQNIDLRRLPLITPWKEGDPVKVGPGQELDGDSTIGVASAASGPAGEEPAGDPSSAAAADGGGDPAAPTVTGGSSGRHQKQKHARRHRAHRNGLDSPLLGTPLSAPFLSFDGVPATGVLPPDTSGDVGPDHFIQVANAAFMVFDKQGNTIAGPSNINALWTGAGGPCEANNDGDPDVRYDPIADRWVLTQFVAYTDFCVAVSQTNDPVAGGWFLYDFNTGGVPNDYPKIAVWPDAYYAGSQRGYPGSGADAWAFDRANMLIGSPAGFVRFFDPGTFLLPGDLDGSAPPPAGAPDVFLRMVDGAQFGGADRLETREFHVDFAVPANSTFTALPDLLPSAFDRSLCGLGLLTTCIPQPGTAQTIEAQSAWPLARLQYRNFGSHETLVVNHTIDVDGADHAGVRWYELRKSGGAWSIFQQGDYSPDQGAPGLGDDPHRWMASAAMDKNQNLAIGYSVSSSTDFPGLRYAGRLSTDAASTLPQGELTLIAGGGSQTHASGRWGDYSSMTVDPLDDCTFWFTSQYYPATSVAGWRTRVGSFRLDATAPVPVCPANTTAECSATGGTPKSDPQLTGFLDGATATDDCDLSPALSNNAPVFFPLGGTSVTFTATDDNGNAADCSASVTVHDTTAPSIDAPPDLTDVECTGPSGASPSLGTPTVADVCDAAPTVTNNAPASFPLGTTIVTWKATDHSGNAATDNQSVTVEDSTPPQLTISVTPTTLWPPNHKLVTIHAAITASDLCDPSPIVTLVSITSSEPDNARGDGNTTSDVQGAAFGTDDRTFQLRAERQGGGSGRVYTITYRAQDHSGNSTVRQATVTVAHDQRH